MSLGLRCYSGRAGEPGIQVVPSSEQAHAKARTTQTQVLETGGSVRYTANTIGRRRDDEQMHSIASCSSTVFSQFWAPNETTERLNG